MALKKINDIYKYKKQTNLLFSLEDFSFIFAETDLDRIETKTKSTLLLLERDLIKKYGFNVLIVRPKSLFSSVYAQIPYENENEFCNKYGKYCEVIEKLPKEKKSTIKSGREIFTLIENNIGNILRIQLDKIWEKYFNKDSFPVCKKKYFEKELFEEFDFCVTPKYLLMIRLQKTKKVTLKYLLKSFEVIEYALSKIIGRYFTKSELENILKEVLKDRILIKRIADLLLNIYKSNHTEMIVNNSKSNDSFIVSRRDSEGEKYRVVSQAYSRTKHSTIRLFNEMFANANDVSYRKFISLDLEKNKGKIKLAYIIESFNLGNYELSGGQLPQIFIRINEPNRINTLANDEKYSNEVLSDVDNRHKNSIKIMEEFFTSKKSNNERWDFIEDYFLGKEIV